MITYVVAGGHWRSCWSTLGAEGGKLLVQVLLHGTDEAQIGCLSLNTAYDFTCCHRKRRFKPGS